MSCEGLQHQIRFNISQSLCPQNVTRIGHTIIVSTECYTNWSHNYCVHRMLHELVTQLLCPQNVTRTATQSLSTACYTHSHTHMLCPQHATLRATVVVHRILYSESHMRRVHSTLHPEPHTHSRWEPPPPPHAT